MTEGITSLPLSNGGFTTLDTADCERYLTLPHRRFGSLLIRPADCRWRWDGGSKWRYARWSTRRQQVQVSVKLHRLILSALPHQKVDHINGDTFDNRRCNLRICTNAENLRNRKSRSGGSKFHGVCREGGRWAAQIQKDYRKINLGRFRHELKAALAYDDAAIELFGEFAALNFPERIY